MFRFLLLALALLLPIGAFAQAASPASLFEAAGRGDIAAVSALLAQGADVNARDAHGNTALAWAELSGDPDTIEARNKGEDGKMQIIGPILWLHPLERGHPDAVTLLVNSGANVNAKDSHYGQTPLIWAAKNHRLALVKLLLDKGADRTLQDKEGQTALTSTWEQSSEIIRLLIDWTAFGRDANMNAPDQSYRTPLMYAAILNDVPRLKDLMHRGAAVKVANAYGETALLKAAAGHDDAIVFLLAHGANANDADKYGWTALRAAARFGTSNSVKLLLDAGANPSTGKGSVDEPPLMMETQSGDTAAMKLLLDKGAAIEERDIYTETALLKACETLQHDPAMLLLDRGAKVDARSRSGETPLLYACQNGWADVVKRLLEAGADPNNATIREGDTPLYFAAFAGRQPQSAFPEIVRLLLAHGADVNAKTTGGSTALSVAREGHHSEIVALLQKAGAKE